MILQDQQGNEQPNGDQRVIEHPIQKQLKDRISRENTNRSNK